MLKKPKRSSFRARMDAMLVSLRDSILTNQYKPGDFIPSESQLIEQYQLSKNSVRKALDMLVSQGLIEKVPHIGTRVIAPEQNAVIRLRLAFHYTMLTEVDLVALINRFHMKHPNILIQSVPLPSHLLTKNDRLSIDEHHHQMHKLLVQENCDLITVNNSDFNRYTMSKQIEEYLEQLEPGNNIYPFLLRAFTHEEKLYAMPFVFSPIILCYNKEHFAEVGVNEPDSSWTWDDAREAAKRLAIKNERLGLFYRASSINRWPIFLLQRGVQFRRDIEGRLVPDNPYNLQAALDDANAAFNNHESMSLFTTDDLSDAEMLFAAGKTSMIVTSYFGLTRIRKPGFAYDLSPLPYINQPRTHLLNLGFALLKSSKNKQAAETFIRFMVSEDTQLHIRQQTMALPCHKNAAEWTGGELADKPLHDRMFRDIIPTYSLYNDLGASYSELEEMHFPLKLYWAGLASFEEVCNMISEIGAGKSNHPKTP